MIPALFIAFAIFFMSNFFPVLTETHPNIAISLLEQNTPVCFNAGGPSMVPTLRDGEPVQVHPIQPEALREGAILLYRKHGRLILHRLIRRNRKSNELLLVGDAALRGQDRVSAEEIIGVATAVQRRGRSLPLNTKTARLRGMLRYGARPLRRLIWGRIHRLHAKTPDY